MVGLPDLAAYALSPSSLSALTDLAAYALSPSSLSALNRPA